MKALSIKQPWASLITQGIKDIENRNWKTNFRGRIYIHASAKSAGEFLYLLSNKQLHNVVCDLPNYYSFEEELNYSAIIGEVDIVDCVINHPSVWAEKTYYIESESGIFSDEPIYNWVLANPVMYDKPILNVKGKLSFWNFDPLNP